jgi:Nickel responsive protein SCO4226-like
MPCDVTRYLIIRTFTVNVDEMPAVGRRSRVIAEERFPQIAWEHSHVTVDDEGVVRTFCIYSAPDQELLREHATALGQHTIDAIREIAGDVSPADFPG